jgi:hypothetical protein
MARVYLIVFAALICLLIEIPMTNAHHVLGRPSYALNEDSNTPSAMQVETQIGDYFINYMVFPAFPRPNEAGRINLYVRRLDGGPAFDGKVEFSVRDDSWSAMLGFGAYEENLGAQILDDHVYRQGFMFRQRGSYIITASFKDDKEHYTIDFPLQVGAPSPYGPIGIAVAIVFIVLALVGLMQRRRAVSGQIRGSRSDHKKNKAGRQKDRK